MSTSTLSSWACSWFSLPVVVAFLSVLQCLGIGFIEDFLFVNALLQRVDFGAKLYQHSLAFFSASIDVVIEDMHLPSKIFSEFICLLVLLRDDLEESLIALSRSLLQLGEQFT